MIRPDDLLPEMEGHVDLIRTDVEGAEPLVFQGAAEMIRRNPAVQIIMEWSPLQIADAGFDIGDFLEQLQALGLKASDMMQDGSLTPLAWEELRGLPYRAGILLTKA